MVLTAEIWAEDGAYNAYCPELDVATYGTSPEHAHSMLKEAVEGMIDLDPSILDGVSPRTVSTLEVAAA